MYIKYVYVCTFGVEGSLIKEGTPKANNTSSALPLSV